MMSEQKNGNNYYFLSGDGEMGALTRAYDWSKTSLGAPDTWPQSLRTTIAIVLSSRFPMFLWWGDDLIQFYNDAYRPSLGNNGKHPSALGQKAIDCWPEIWEIIYPLIQKVRTTGEATWSEDQLLPIYRNGKIEDVYWTFGYSAVKGEDGKIEGVLVVCNETTGKVQTVQKLVESEKRFQTLVNEATTGIIVLFGDDLMIEVVNNAYCQLVERNAEDLLGKSLMDVFPERKYFFQPIAEEVRKSGEPHYMYDHPYSIKTNGTIKQGFVNVVYQPYKEDDGKIAGVMVLCQDVTDQVQARQKIVESEQRVRSLVESAPFPIGVYVGKEMRIELANGAILDTWGKGNDVVGKLYADILPELDNQLIFQQLDDVYTKGIPFHAKNQRVDLMVDGKLQPFYFNYSFTPLYDSAGKVYGVMNTAADVTDLAFAKQRVEESGRNLRNLILKAPVAMCILSGPDHVVEIANDRMIELWGRTAEEVMHKSLFEGLPEVRNQGFEQLLQQVFSTGETYSAHDVPVSLPRNGKVEIVYVNFVYEAYRETESNISGVIAVAVDVTAQVLARQKIEEVVADRTKELATVNTNLERSNAELAQFAYIASHDLQEPLRKVGTFTQMLEQSLEHITDRSQNFLDKIHNSTARMTALIRDVLAYSQLAKGIDAYKRVDLNNVIEGIKGDYELQIEQKQAKIITSDLPTIEAVPLQMSQLFSNLISNALKFSKAEEEPVITIESRRATVQEIEELKNTGAGMTYYNIEIKDNGIGFNQDYAAQIFNIFQRLHGRAEYSGTGIGLAICKKIAQNHHGEIYAKSGVGSGATFNVILPASQSVTG